MPNVRGRLSFIEFLRGPAALLVAWDHLGNTWPDRSGYKWWAAQYVRDWVAKPLAIIQDFGALAVAVFFLISGFIIVHALQSETRAAFLIKRALRIYPPFIVSVLILLALNKMLAATAGFPDPFGHARVPDVLFSMTLMTYWLSGLEINGVGWTLWIEVLFYALCFLLLPWLQRRPRLALGGALFLGVAVLMCRTFSSSFFLFAVSFGYLPFLFLGSAIYYLYTNRISKTWFAIFSAAFWLLFVANIRLINTAFYPPENSYGVSFGFAWLLFALCVAVGENIKGGRVCLFFSNISYSFYLNHGGVGMLLLSLLVPRVGFEPALLVTFLGVTALSWASWRYVERPAQAAGRRLAVAVNELPVLAQRRTRVG